MKASHGVRTKSTLRSAVLAACVLLGGAHAEAAPRATKPAKASKTQEAKDLAVAKKKYAEGVAKFKEGNYTDALAAFQAADDIKSTAQAARYIALCLDNLGRYQAAIATYERFLASAPEKMAEQATEARARVEAIKKLPGKIHVTSDPPGAAFTVDGVAWATTTPADVEMAPGHHVVHFTVTGHDAADRELDVTFASRHEIDARLATSVAPPPPPPPAQLSPEEELRRPIVIAPPPPLPEPPPPPLVQRSLVPAWVLGGIGVVAAGTGAVFGGLALSDKNAFTSNPTSAKADDGQRNAQAADICFGVAGAFALTAGLYLVFRDSYKEPATTGSAGPTLHAVPMVSAHGGGAAASVTF
jgi:hypothetical protein